MKSRLRLSTSVKTLAVIFIAALLVSCHICERKPLLTALERSGYSQLTSSSEIRSLLAELAERNANAENITIARSALGSPVEALLVSSEMSLFRDCLPTPGKMSVMLVGSQHGMEPSGAEALLLTAREIVEGDLIGYLEDMNFIFIPNSNPDGRDLNRRVNGNGVNLSTDFAVLCEPESRGLMDVLHRWKPEVVLDVHESAVLKKKSLARQGYLIDFECQFEAANNPNVDEQIRTFSFERFLPGIIRLVNDGGLLAQRYVGEITDVHQPIAHGGLSVRNLRNMGGMMGAFSFLLENRLDPSTGTYPTPRNIEVRVSKQCLSVKSFLRCCEAYHSEIIRLSGNARMRWKNDEEQELLYLSCAYVSDQSQPTITLPLRRLESGERIRQLFDYHRAVNCHRPLTLPAAYVIAAHHKTMRDFLDRHRIEYEVSRQPSDLFVEIQHIDHRKDALSDERGKDAGYVFSKRTETYSLREGDLVIHVGQPARRLIPLLLELESMSSIFRSKAYSQLVKEHEDFFIYRVCESFT